jgi:hypothetical protein
MRYGGRSPKASKGGNRGGRTFACVGRREGRAAPLAGSALPSERFSPAAQMPSECKDVRYLSLSGARACCDQSGLYPQWRR